MRTKSCRKLLEAVCSDVAHVEIDPTGIALDGLDAINA